MYVICISNTNTGESCEDGIPDWEEFCRRIPGWEESHLVEIRWGRKTGLTRPRYNQIVDITINQIHMQNSSKPEFFPQWIPSQ